MTRETKVGLVVGTGIILLIGIVVSDHLASQQRGQQQTAAPTGYQDYPTGNQPRVIDPRSQAGTPSANQPGTGNTLAPLPPAGAARGNNIGNGPRTESIPLQQIDPLAAAGNPALPGGAVTDRNLDAALGQRNTPGSATNNGNTTSDAGSRPADNTLPRDMASDLRGSGFLPEDNTPRFNNPTGNVSDAGRIPVGRPTEPLIHHVQAGESLWAISEKFYGEGKHYNEIARANGDKLLADGGVREGVRLVIPNKTIVSPGGPVVGNTPTNIDARGNVIENRLPGNSIANAAPTMRTIKVESGDALSTIASRELGSIRHMQVIIDANKDQIRDANDIQAGMTLRIPALPAVNTGSSTGTTSAAPTRTIAESATTTRVNKTYTVQPRDTFSSIARARLGDDRRWKEIFELNKSTVRSADALRAGVEIILP